MFTVAEIKDKKQWEDFVLSQTHSIFLQSPRYGEFYERMGERSWIFGAYEGGKLIAGTLAVTVHAKRGSFLFLPYGPLISEKKNRGEILRILIAHLSDFAKKQKFDFLKISPFWKHSQTDAHLFKEFGCRDAPMHILAENTWMLDLAPSYENLLAGMEKTHRYLIRRCEKEGVKIVQTHSIDALAEFNHLHDLTADRHKFHRFSADYIRAEFESFAPKKEAAIFQAFLPDGRLDSAAIIIYYGNMAAYRHGASANLNSKLSTSYLIQWEAIKEAKRRGMQLYNFWGVAPANAGKTHPFYGFTHFKKGFGGFNFDLIHCRDLPLTKKYYLNWAIEKLRGIKRGFK